MKAPAGAVRTCLVLIVLLIALRLVVAALLPLSADEAYYWLWSKHLAAGYFDHPPAIAICIRLGTALFGDTSLGVRLVAVLLSIPASWFVWRAGAILLGDEMAGARACLFFNATLMVAVEMMAATPDAPSIAAAAFFVYGLARVEESGDGRWWLAVGTAAGLALISKYTGFFLGLGILAWLVAAPRARRWLLTPWPYLGGFLALLIFAPNLWWNRTHGWTTFLFQFGRVADGHYTLRFLFEFLGAQLLLATPFIFFLGAYGLGSRTGARQQRSFILAALIWPSIAYFTWHALHDRVQGNWPSFLYPAFAIAAAAAVQRSDGASHRLGALLRLSSRMAVPLALVLLFAADMQALFGIVPLGRKDPAARLLAVGFVDVAQKIDQLRKASGAKTILTSDYESTAWLSFYLPQHCAIVQANEEWRWPDAPKAAPALFAGPLLYVAEQGRGRDRHSELVERFAHIIWVGTTDRVRHGVTIARYVVYRVEGLRGSPFGRVPGA